MIWLLTNILRPALDKVGRSSKVHVLSHKPKSIAARAALASSILAMTEETFLDWMSP